MTESTDTYPGDRAFAGSGYHITEEMATKGVEVDGAYGLTKREYFACRAMQGILSSSITLGSEHETCQSAVIHADALIAALNKPKE
jgi:hypothetical protein